MSFFKSGSLFDSVITRFGLFSKCVEYNISVSIVLPSGIYGLFQKILSVRLIKQEGRLPE